VNSVKADEKAAIDLTRIVKGTYGYLLKLNTNGRKGAAAIKSLVIDTWVQVAPISLPRLKKGQNHLRYEVGDRYGLATVPMLVNPNTAEPKDLEKYAVKMPADYDPLRHTCRIRAEIVLRLAAPARRKIKWFTVGATFRTYQGQQAKKTDNRIAYAVGRPENFKEIYRSIIPTWVNHWRYSWDTDVMLEEPADEIYVKYTGNPGLNTVRACLHLLAGRPPQERVRIVHGYRVNGQFNRKTVDVRRPISYTVQCDSQPENVFIEISVPSK
jgi:hypothetical protein